MAITFTQWIDQTFQSTLSMRRATWEKNDFTPDIKFQSTLSMRRATLMVIFASQIDAIFQSTLSMRRATNNQVGRVAH